MSRARERPATVFEFDAFELGHGRKTSASRAVRAGQARSEPLIAAPMIAVQAASIYVVYSRQVVLHQDCMRSGHHETLRSMAGSERIGVDELGRRDVARYRPTRPANR